jgi:predicted TIM-barrel fold metal-dependent hydrolase
MIVDCHVHLSRYGHAGQSFRQIRDSLLADMDREGVGLSLVYPDSEPNTDVSDLPETRELVRGQPRLRLLGTAHMPTLDEAAVAQLAGLAARGEICGLKLYPGFEPFYPADERCLPLYDICAAHGLPVVFHSGETMNDPAREVYNHPLEIARVAQRYPTLPVVVAHFSQPHLEACRDLVLAYANVHADLSGLAHPQVVALCAEREIARILAEVARVQPEKLLFGTDWPICDVGAHLELVRTLPVSEGARALILGGNARRIFGLPQVP